MKFETNLSSKDKKTIALVLGAASVFMFIWFGIKPTVTSILELDEEITQARITKTENDGKIMSLNSFEAIFTKAVNDLGDSTEEYYPIMQSSEIDRMMTSYVLGFGLYPENMTINMPTAPVVEAPYAYADIQPVTAVPVATPTPTPKPSASSGSSSSSSANAQPKPVDSLIVPYEVARASATSTSSSGVYCVELSYTVTGTQEQCQALIDDISVKPSIRLTGFEWSEVDPIAQENEEDGTIEYVDSGLVRLRVDFNLYMTDVADYCAIVEEAADSAVEED